MMSEGPVMSDRTGRLALLTCFLLVFGAAAFTSQGFPFRARVFPMTVGVAGAVLSLIAILKELWVGGRRGVGEGDLSGAAAGASAFEGEGAVDAGKALSTDESGGADWAVGADGSVGAHSAEQVPAPGSLVRYLLWVLGYYAVIWVAGLVVGSGLFVAGFLYREARARVWTAVVAGALTVGALFGLGRVLRLEWISSVFGG